MIKKAQHDEMVKFNRGGMDYERHKVVDIIVSVLLFASIVLPIIGTLCVFWFNYKLGVKIFNIGCVCILVYLPLKLVIKICNDFYW